MMTDSAKTKALRDFLADSFNRTELNHFLAFNGYEEVTSAVIPQVGDSEYFVEVAKALSRRGVIGDAFFQSLTQVRPDKKERIQNLKSRILDDQAAINADPPKPEPTQPSIPTSPPARPGRRLLKALMLALLGTLLLAFVGMTAYSIQRSLEGLERRSRQLELSLEGLEKRLSGKLSLGQYQSLDEYTYKYFYEKDKVKTIEQQPVKVFIAPSDGFVWAGAWGNLSTCGEIFVIDKDAVKNGQLRLREWSLSYNDFLIDGRCIRATILPRFGSGFIAVERGQHCIVLDETPEKRGDEPQGGIRARWFPISME